MAVTGFPVLSQTFISLQISSLIDEGFDVTVINFGPTGDFGQFADDVKLNLESTEVIQLRSGNGRNLPGSLMKVLPQLLYFSLFRPRFLFLAIKKVFLKKGSKRFSQLIALAYSLRFKCFDVVHIQFLVLAEHFALLKMLGFFSPATNLACSVRGFDISKKKNIQRFDRALIFGQIKYFLPVCDFFKRRLINMGCESAIRIIHSPINLAKIKRAKNHNDRVKNQTIEFVSVGRLVEKKGFDDALKAFSELKKINHKFRYTIIGEGKLKNELMQDISRYGLSDCVVLAGAMRPEDVIEYMNNSDVLLAPSKTASDGDSEGIPNVIKEAMALGLPVVATRHSGIPELVDHGVDGLLCAEGSPDELYDILIQMTENLHKYEKLSKSGKEKITRLFSPAATTKELVDVYKAIL